MEEEFKQSLLSNDKYAHFQTVYQIHMNFLSMTGEDEWIAYAKTLIEAEIARILCHLVGNSDKIVLSSTLAILTFTSQCKEFYTLNIARRAMTCIIQRGVEFANSDEHDIEMLIRFCNIMTEIFTRSYFFSIFITKICHIDAVFEFINSLSANDATNALFITSIANLYASVVPYIYHFDEYKRLTTVMKIHEDILFAAYKVIRNYKYYDDLLENIMEPITIICNAGVRFYYTPMRTGRSDPLHVHLGIKPLERIFEITKQILFKSVIPNSRHIDVTTQFHCTSSLNFVTCMCELYKNEGNQLENTSWLLAENGYLLYFYEMWDDTKSYNESLCDLLAYIIRDVATSFLSIDKWTTGLDGFRQFLKNDFMSLTQSTSSETSFIKDCFLFTIYIHFHTTKKFNLENYICSIVNMDLSRKILNIPLDCPLEVPTLQVIVFLFSASIVGRPSEDINNSFYNALIHLTDILLSTGTNDYYTFNASFPLLLLEGSVLPTNISDNLLKLWVKFNNNIFLLLTPGPSHILIDAIFKIYDLEVEEEVEECSEVLDLLLEYCVNPSLTRKEQFTQSLWTNLDNIISYYTQPYESAMEVYLEILNTLEYTKLLNISVTIDCARSLTILLSRDDIAFSTKMKKLLIDIACKLLHVALISDERAVGWIFVHSYSTINWMYSQAFTSINEEIISVSFEFFSLMIFTQEKFAIDSQRPIEVPTIALYLPLMPRNINYFSILNVYDRLFSNTVNSGVITVVDDTDEEFDEALAGIYRLFCIIHMNSREPEWEYTFICMTNFLKYMNTFCSDAVPFCCEYICNSEIINICVMSNYDTYRFFHFAKTWITLSICYRTRSVLLALESRDERRQAQENNFSKTRFLTAMYNLAEHCKRAIKIGHADSPYITEVLNKVKEFI